jgi:O-antigen/teichoic acid export membrane protein
VRLVISCGNPRPSRRLPEKEDVRELSGRIRELLRHFLTYGIGQVLGKLLGFLLLPLYTRFLTPEDYGVLSLIAVYSAILFVFISVGLSTGIFRFYLESDDRDHRSAVLTSALSIMAAMAAPCAALVLARNLTSELLTGTSRWGSLVAVSTLTTYLDLLLKLPYCVMRARQDSLRYTAANFVQTLLELVLAFVFIVPLRAGPSGIVWAQCLGTLAIAPYLLRFVFADFKFIWRPELVRGLLRFGLPLIPAGLSAFALTLSDRYFLKALASLEEVGLYSVGYRFGQTITFVAMAFQLVWSPFVFLHQTKDDAGPLFARVATYYVVGLGLAALGLHVFSRELTTVMTGPQFRGAQAVIGIVALSQYFLALNNLATAGILIRQRTSLVAGVVTLAAAINVGLNFYCIRRWGMVGAAWTTLIAYFVQLVGSLTASQRVFSIPFERRRIVGFVGVAALIAWIGVLPDTGSMWVDVALKLSLFLLFPVLAFAGKWFDADELEQLSRAGRAMSRRLAG